MFVSWDERIALVNSALCHAYIYACAPEPSMDAHGKDAQRHEGLAYHEADHFQTLRDRHRGNGLYFRAKIERKRDPGLLALSFDVDLTGCHVIKHLVRNISRTLVTQHVPKFASTRLQKTVDFDIYKIFEDLFPSKDERDSMFLEGIHNENLTKLVRTQKPRWAPSLAVNGELTQRRRQRQRKRHLKINIWEMVTIFRLLLLPRILYCW